MKKAVCIILVVGLIMVALCGCNSEVKTVAQTDVYEIHADGSESLLYYSVTTITLGNGVNTSGDASTVIELYSGDGQLISTMDSQNAEIVRSDYDTTEIDAKSAIISLVGTGNADLVEYSNETDSSGKITDEWFVSLSEEYTSLHLVYTYK